MIVFDQLRKNDPHLRAVTWGVLLGLLVLLAGLWWVQIFSYRHYSENQKAQSFRTVRIPAVRGKILDRHGLPLAENAPSYNVNLYLDEMRDAFRAEWKRLRSAAPAARSTLQSRIALESLARYSAASNVVENLSQVLQMPGRLSYEEFHRHYSSQLALPMPVFLSLNSTQSARFLEQAVVPRGVDLDVVPVRVYPRGAMAAHLLGYLTQDNSSVEGEEADFNFRLPDYRGRVGIEGAYDPELRGRAGAKSVLVNSLGYRQSETMWEETEAGRNIVLTIDAGIQYAAEQALREAVTSRPQVCGAVVVMNPTNGDVLALVSAPAFDPNRFIPRISQEDYAHLNDPILRPQINRAMQENYAPGSIFKILIAMTMLENGLNPSEIVHVPADPFRPTRGCIYIGRRKIEDTAEPGDYDFKRAFIKSSNTYFITNGLKVGVESIVRLGRRLHLGERVNILANQESPGYFPEDKELRGLWRDGDTANLCIGQGRLSVTPMQMAVMVSAVANGGTVLWPRLVDRVQSPEAESEDRPVHFPYRPPRDDLGVKPHTLDVIRQAMLADVEDVAGTGRAAAVPGFRVCGKTGTAQVTNERGQKVDQTTWFASYAPFENPRYTVIVMVESGASGGGTCAPVARKIYQAIAQMEARQNPAGALAKNP